MLNRDDIIKFYELHSRLSPTSSNIGVVGNRHRFEILVRDLLKRYKKDKNVKIRINPLKTHINIIQNDVETNFIHIQDLNDLTGRFFRKYM